MKPKDTHADRPSLERDKVVTVALELLNEVGFEGLTLRKLADRLHVKAAALYWHFENKQDLVDQVALRIIEDEFRSGSARSPEEFSNATWRDVLELMGRGMRNALRRHRDGALVVANANLANSKSFKGRAMMFQKLLNEGFDMPLVFSSMFSVVRYTLGCVFEEQADPRSHADIRKMYIARQQELLKECPELADKLKNISADEAFMSADFQFERGLKIILDGIEAQLAKSV